MKERRDEMKIQAVHVAFGFILVLVEIKKSGKKLTNSFIYISMVLFNNSERYENKEDLNT